MPRVIVGWMTSSFRTIRISDESKFRRWFRIWVFFKHTPIALLTFASMNVKRISYAELWNSFHFLKSNPIMPLIKFSTIVLVVGVNFHFLPEGHEMILFVERRLVQISETTCRSTQLLWFCPQRKKVFIKSSVSFVQKDDLAAFASCFWNTWSEGDLTIFWRCHPIVIIG